MRSLLITCLLTTMLLLTGCETPSHPTISHAWIAAAPPNSNVLAGYADLNNSSDKAWTLSTIHSPSFEHIMLHQTNLQGGMSRMTHLANPTLASGEQLLLAPSGKHLMLMRPKQVFKAGHSITVHFEFTSLNTPAYTLSHTFQVK